MAENNVKKMYEYFSTHKNDKGNAFFGGTYDEFRESLADNNVRLNMYNHLSQANIFKGSIDEFDNELGFAQPHQIEQVQPQQVEQQEQPQFEYVSNQKKGFGQRAKDAVWGGTLKLGAGIIDAMSRFGAAQAQADAYKYGGLENQERVNEQVTQARESLNKGEGIGQKYLGTKADAISEENQQRYGYNEDGSAKGTMDLWKEGKIGLGLEKAFMDGLASAPTTLVALAGPAGLVALGAGSAEQKYEQLKAEQPEMSEGAMITNAVLTGAFESATEYIGKLPILRNWKLFKDPTTEEVLREQIERLGQSWVKKYIGGTLESLGIQMGQEALEEATNAIAGMALDKATGVERGYSIDEVIDAAMAGAMGGATGGSALSGVGMGVGAYRQRKGRKAMVEYNEAYNVALEQMGGQYNQWEASLDESVDKTALRQTLGNLTTQYANGSLSRADLRAELINMGVKPSQMPTDSELLGLLAIEQDEADGGTGWFAGGRKSKELKLSAYLNGYYGAGAQEEILGFMRQNNLSQEQFVDLMTNNKPTAEQVGLRNKFYESMEGHREAQQLRYKFLNKFCEENGVTEDQLDMMLQRRAQGIELKDWELELSNRFDEAMSNYEHENKIKAQIDGKAQIAVDLIRRQTNNSNGRLQNVRVGNEEAPSIIKQGNVSILMNKEGKLYIDEQNSDDVVVVTDTNGENARQIGIKELTPLFDGLAKEVQGMAVESIERGVRNADTFTQGTMIALPNGQAGIVQSVGEDGSIAMFDFQGNPITIAPQDTENARKVTFTEGMNVGGVTIEGVQEDGNLIVNGEVINPSEFASGMQQYLYDSAGQTPKAPIVTPQQAQEVQTNAASVQLQQDIADAKELGDDFVNTMLTQAQKSLDKASKQKPTGTDANSYRASKNKIDAQVAQAQAEVDRWLAVQQALAQEQIQNTINNEQNESPKVENANQVGNVARDKFVNSKRFEGNTSVRTLPNGTQIKGRYMLVSAESLTPSHNPLDNWNTSEGFPLNERGQNINDRDYKNDVSAQNETMRIAQQYGGQAVEQVPTVSPEGVVYDGNGRTMAGIIAAQNGTDASYIETLKANASNFGFTPQQVNEIPSARVVFVTDEVLPYTTQTFAQFNQQEKKTQSSTENAVAKSKSLDAQTISQLLSVVDSFATLDSFFTSPIACADMLKVLQEKGIIAPTEVAGLTETNKNGELVFNAHGREFITDVLIGANFTENVIRQMAGDKGLKQSVLRALNVIIANRKLGEFALTKHINNAISLIREANNAKLSVSLYLRQTNMFEALATERYTAFEILMAEQLQSGVENFRELLSKYNNYARENQGGQIDMFAEGGLLSIEDITNIILEQYGHRTTQTEHAIQSSSRGENRANEEGIRERKQGNSEQQPNDTTELERKLLHLKEGESIKDFFERLKKTKEPILNRIQEWQNKVGVPVEVIISPSTIKNKIAYNEIAKGTNVKGWYDPNTGKAYIYLPNAESVKDVDETVMHEIIAHKGLRELLGKEKFDELCDAVWDMMSEKQRAEKLAYLNSTGAHRNATQQERQRAAADEYIAFLAENVQLKEDLTVWKSVVRKIKDILKSLGIKFRMSDEQLGELLRESARMFRDNARNASQNNEQDNAGSQFAEVNFRITYHGSGAKFDKFDRFAQRSGLIPNKLGVKGIYVSDSEEVGTNYALTNRYRGEGKSHLYKVEIPDDRGWNYIHWESKAWKSFLRDVNKVLEWDGYRAIDKSEVHSNYRPNDKGVVFEVLRRKLGYDKDLLTRYLRKMGIVGISYPSYYEDKNVDKNARSYVIFDENDLEIKDVVSFRITPADDKAYMDAVERGDMKTAQKMVDDAAEKTGYNSDTAYQGSLAFNGSAPSSNAYFETKEARKEAWQNGEYEDTMSLGDFVDSGIDTNDLEWQLNDPRAIMNKKLFTIESIRNLRNTVRSGKRTIKMYRAVDANIKENSFRNGDWITPSRRYAKEHVTLQDWKRSRIIEQEVSIDDIWWNGDDINEWGYDDGKDYGYQNTKNNRKLLDAVTYDDNGNVIPLSKRFNKRNEDVRFRITPEMIDANNQFNEELQQQIDGTLPKGHIYQIGMPSNILRSAGVVDLPIELSAERLYAKSMQENHPFSLESVSNLPMAIQNPIAVFDSRTNKKSKVILTELQYDGNNFVVALRLRNEGEGIDLEVNSIQSLYPKDKIGGVIEWVNSGLLRYANKNKLVDFLTQSTNLIAGKETDLNDATKLIQNFENPKLSEENFENNDIRFRVGTQIIETDNKTLVGLHNISESKFKEAMKRGGLANPSFAVIDTEKQSFDDFGEISLIMPSSLVDPKGNSGVYTGDIWSPTYPRIRKQIDKKGWKKIDDTIDALIEDKDIARGTKNSLFDYIGDGSSANAEYAFLVSKGITPKIVRKTNEGIVSTKELKDILGVSEDLNIGWDTYEAYKNLPEEKKEEINLWRYVQGGRQRKDDLVKRLNSEPKTEFAKGVKMSAEFAIKRELSFAEFDTFIYDVVSKEEQNGTVDVRLTQYEARQYCYENNLDEEYRSWLNNLIDSVNPKEVFFTGYDYEGNPKYAKATLENISRHMKKEGVKNAYNNTGFDATRALLLKKLATLKEIQSNKDLLKTSDAVAEEIEVLKDKLYDIISRLSDMEKISDNQFMNIDYANARLQEAIVKRNPIQYLNSEYGYDIEKDGEFAKDLSTFIEEVKLLPAKYFEGKFTRPVYLSEFSAAVVPNTISPSTTSYFVEANVPIYTYNPSVEGSRQEATMEAINNEGVRFRITPEMEQIKSKAQADGTFMKAPNGKSTNLDERQWLHVRTENFKNYFGDWINDPENASKVADENGEPKVMYHGTPNKFNIFDQSKIERGNGFWFTSELSEAESYAWSEDGDGNVISVFLNAKNPATLDEVNGGLLEEYRKEVGAKVSPEVFVRDKQASDYMRSKGYDALMFDDKVIVYKPNQIKSATENEGGYSESNNDIRFRVTPESTPIFVSNALVATQKIKQEKATPQQWLAMIEKNAGIKAGEDKWLGLSDWLKSSTAKTLTKDEVLEYIRENMIDVQEVWYGETSNGEDKLAEFNAEFNAFYDETDRDLDSYERADLAFEEMVDKYGDDFRAAFDIENRGYEVKLYPLEDLYGDITPTAKYFLDLDDENSINYTRLNYTTEGLDNKKEVALVVPTIDSWNQSDAIHFGDAGDGRAVAWVRFGETYDADGNSVLVIDEIQSKRHQAGRDVGYTDLKSYEKEKAILDEKASELLQRRNKLIGTLTEKYGDFTNYTKKIGETYSSKLVPNEDVLTSDEVKEWNETSQDVIYEAQKELDKKYRSGVPDAPFEKNWQELAMKRMMRYATENGFDKLAWTKGEQQAKRYALSNTVEVIHAEDSLSEMEDGTEIKKEIAITTTQDSIIRLYVDANGNVLSGEFKGKHLSEIVGKDVALRLMADGEVTLKPMDLEIGGEGMKGFYDKMLPSFVNKYGKKWGVKVGEVTLPYVEEAGRTMHSIDITDTMKEQLDAEAQPMFRILANPAALVNAPKPNEVGHENETFMEYLQRYEQWRNDKIAYENYTDSEIPQFPSWDKDRMTFKQYLDAINDYKRGVEKLELVSVYNQAFFTKWKEFKEAMKTLVDTGHRIRAFYKWMKSQGADIDPKDNAYNDSHRRNSRMQHVLRVFEQNQKLNMMNAMNAILRSGKLDGLGFTWQNIDSDTTPAKERRNGTPLTRQEILSVYAQAKDCKEAKELGLPDRGENAFKNNLGMSYQDVIDAVEGAVDPRMIYNLWDAIKAVNDFALDYQLKYGMIDQATRDSLNRKYYVPERGWKVRDMDGKIDGYMPSKNGSKYSSFNPALVKAHGRTSLASDPFPYMLSIAHSSVVATEKNRTLQALYRGLMKNERLGRETGAYKIRRIWGMIAKDENGNTIYDREGKPITLISYEAPTAEMYKHDKEIDEQVKELRKENSKLRDEYVNATPTRQAEINQEVSDNNAKIKKLEESKYMTAMIEDTTIKYRTKNETQQHIVKLKVDGADVEIEFKDEKLANAINGGNWVSNMNDGWMKNTISRISKFTQKLSSWKTQYNYEFAVANFARDLILSHMINGIREGEVFALKASKEVFASMGTIASYLSNGKNLDKMKDSKRKQYLQEFLENGALTGFSFTKPIEDISEELYKELMQLDGDNRTTQEKVARLKHLFAEKGENALAFLSELSEMSVRFAQYVTCRDAGKTIEASATSAKEITTNFDRKSQLGNAFGWLYGFFNAAIQGTMNIAYAVKDNPKRGAAMLSAWSAIFVGLGYAMASLFAPDDPEDETYLTEWDRWTNLTIPLPGKNTIVIPLPHVMRAFNALGVNMAMVEKGRKPLNQAIGDVVQFFLDELTPSSPLQIQNFADYNDRTGKWEMDFVKYAQGAMPTAIQPIMDTFLDRNFMNAPIAKRVWNDNIADIHRANNHTEQFFIDFARWLNKISGGDPNMETKYKGWDFNPSNIKHILTGYGGGLPQLIIDTGRLIYNKAKGNDIQTGEIPFLRKVVRTYDDKKAYTSEYWDLKNKVDNYKATLKDASKNSPETYDKLVSSEEYEAYVMAQGVLDGMTKPKEATEFTQQDINDMIWANKMMNKGKVVEKPE